MLHTAIMHIHLAHYLKRQVSELAEHHTRVFTQECVAVDGMSSVGGESGADLKALQ